MTPLQEAKPVFTFTLHNRTLQLTREGGGFIVLAVGIGVGAINTGNNLLYLVLAMCCSLIAVSGILSEITLRRVTVEATLPKSFYKNDPTPLFFTVTNRKKKIPSYSLHVDLSHEAQGNYLLDQTLYFAHLKPNTPVKRGIHLTALHRGKCSISSVRLITGFPFGFFVKTKTVPLHVESVVFPEINHVELPEPNEMASEAEGVVKQRGDDLYALREFQTGDALESVHWKSSAKTGALRVKEFEGGGHQSFTIFLNTKNSETNHQVEDSVLEQRVTESASLIYHLIQREDEVRLKTPEMETAYGNTDEHLKSLMHYLAFVGADPAP